MSSSRHRDPSKGPSQRQLRVAELVRHAVADALTRHEVADPVLDTHVVTVPEVRLSPDLKVATIYVMPLGGQDGRAIVKALAAHAGYLRSIVARRVAMKFAPTLRFQVDETFDYAARIDGLLRRPEVSRDLEHPLPGSEPADGAPEEQP